MLASSPFSLTVHRLPDPRRRRGAVERRDAERRQRVEDRVGDRGKGGDRAGLAAALHAEWIGRAAGAVERQIERRQVVGELVASGVDEITIKRNDPAVGEVSVHFPRAGFAVTPA